MTKPILAWAMRLCVWAKSEREKKEEKERKREEEKKKGGGREGVKGVEE